jgi:predicted membrane channel-forming protein YqfA (hemolysin III family)
METKQKNKLLKILYILLMIAGCVLACSTIISNDYLKVAIVLVTITTGLFGFMKSLGGSPEENTDGEDKNTKTKQS